MSGKRGRPSKDTENGHCLFRDGAYDLIRGIKSGAGLVFAPPVYYFDVPSQMRAILERLFYPGNADHEIQLHFTLSRCGVDILPSFTNFSITKSCISTQDV